MSESGTARPAARAVELLTIERFQVELRRAAPFRSGPAIVNPLGAAVSKIEENPAFAESRLLTRVLGALTNQPGEFRLSEIAAFDSKTLSMVVALLDVHAAGTTAQAEWTVAVERANAAQLGVGG